MSRGFPSHVPALVRVTVTSATRRVDLVLPAAVPVAELMPELARGVGVLDAVTAYGGYRLVTVDGRVLAGDRGLTAQGVEDGGLITVVADVDAELPVVYDDVVEAMSDVMERDLAPWEAAAGRRTALSAAVLLLLLGAGALLLQHGSREASNAAIVVAAGLMLGAVALSRTRHETDAAVTLALVACLYAAIAPAAFTWHTAVSATPVTAAGAGAIAAAAVGVLGLTDGRTLMLLPLAAGAVLLATGPVVRGTSVDPAVALTTVLVLVVIAGGAFPWLALGATGTGTGVGLAHDRGAAAPHRVDPGPIAADVRLAHEILVAVSGSVGLVLALAAPLAVSLGVAGTLVSVLACLVVLLRTRHSRARAQVLVGLVSGVLGLVSTALAAAWLRPGWRSAEAVVLVATGAAVLVPTLLPGRGSVRRSRLGDLAETLTLLGLVPSLVVATGLCSWVAR
jgi:type VII secretion integral membrane protein EccD